MQWMRTGTGAGDRRPSGAARSAVVAAAVGLLLAGCDAGDVDVRDAVQRVESEVAERVVPVLAAEGPSDAAWVALDEALRAARADDLLVVRGPNAFASDGTGDVARMEVIVAIVGPDQARCQAVVVDAEGAVSSLAVPGDATAACRDADIPEMLQPG